MTHQKDLFAVSEAQAEKVQVADMQFVRGIRNFRSAMNELILAGKHSHESLGDKIGKRKEQISKFSSNVSGLKGDDIDKIVDECNSLVLAQYLANKVGFVVVDAKVHEAMKTNFIQEMVA